MAFPTRTRPSTCEQRASLMFTACKTRSWRWSRQVKFFNHFTCLLKLLPCAENMPPVVACAAHRRAPAQSARGGWGHAALALHQWRAASYGGERTHQQASGQEAQAAGRAPGRRQAPRCVHAPCMHSARACTHCFCPVACLHMLQTCSFACPTASCMQRERAGSRAAWQEGRRAQWALPRLAVVVQVQQQAQYRSSLQCSTCYLWSYSST